MRTPIASLLLACALLVTFPASATERVYTIKPGDTLLEIAFTQKLTLPDILKANPQIKNPNLIQVGDTLALPGEQVASLPPSSTTRGPKPVLAAPVAPPRRSRLQLAFLAPPDRGLPANREAAASRGCAKEYSPKPDVLVPRDSNLGLTISPRPTFFGFTPNLRADAEPPAVEFSLWSTIESANGLVNNEQLYAKNLDYTPGQGVQTFTLPEDSPALEEGKTYHWYMSLRCDLGDRSADVNMEGWVKRIAKDAGLSRELMEANPLDHPAIYAKAGLWYDALESLVAMRKVQPGDSVLDSQWLELLKSGGLEKLASQPMQ